MDDLFGYSSHLEKVAMEDADVSFLSRASLPRPASEYLKILIDTVPWRAEKVTVWGKQFDQPRLIAWFGNPGKSYKYSGIYLTPEAWTAPLLELKTIAEDLSNQKFNSALLNYYRDENDSMGFHSDDEKELGINPVIASMSLGQERSFIFKHKTQKQLKPVRINLTSGSFLLMKGETQKNWKHGIEKEKSACGPRVNLTFRKISAP